MLPRGFTFANKYTIWLILYGDLFRELPFVIIIGILGMSKIDQIHQDSLDQRVRGWHHVFLKVLEFIKNVYSQNILLVLLVCKKNVSNYCVYKLLSPALFPWMLYAFLGRRGLEDLVTPVKGPGCNYGGLCTASCCAPVAPVLGLAGSAHSHSCPGHLLIGLL